MVIIIRQKTNKRPPYTRLRPELALTQTQIVLRMFGDGNRGDDDDDVCK